MTTATATHRRGNSVPDPSKIKTGNEAVDDVIGSLFLDLLEKGAKQGNFFSIPRAWVEANDPLTCSVGQLGKATFEGRVSAALSESSRGFRIPWQAKVPAIEQRAGVLDTGAGSGSIATVIPDGYMIEVMRNKLVCQKLGAQVTNFTASGPHGEIQLPQKLTSANVSWVAQNASPSQSNMTVGARYLNAKTVCAFTDISRRQTDLGQPGFVGLVIADLLGAIAVEVDRVCLNGLGSPFNIFGLFQVDVAMKRGIGRNNADAPADARMGWLTSNAGRAQLEITDMGGALATGASATGRYAWKSKQHVIDGKLTTCESMLGWQAEATASVPEQFGTSSNLTSIAVGNFSDMIINFWGDGVDILIDWTKFSTLNVLRIAAFFDVDMVIRRPLSFVTYTGFAS
jgi:HK97 family phage major capsid protein